VRHGRATQLSAIGMARIESNMRINLKSLKLGGSALLAGMRRSEDAIGKLTERFS